MHVRWVVATLLGSALVAGPPAAAQQSASFRLDQGTVNYGGDPRGGVSLGSAAYRITLDAIGPWAGGQLLASASFSLSGGFVSSYGPPVEVQNLLFSGPATLVWSPQPAAGDYALYGGTVTRPFDPGYGSCQQPPPSLTSPTAAVGGVPAAGQSSFYLVTARNLLSEEGTKGFTSAGLQRANAAPCP